MQQLPPNVKELKQFKTIEFTPTEVDLNLIPWKDKKKEALRQQTLLKRQQKHEIRASNMKNKNKKNQKDGKNNNNNNNSANKKKVQPKSEKQQLKPKEISQDAKKNSKKRKESDFLNDLKQIAKELDLHPKKKMKK